MIIIIILSLFRTKSTNESLRVRSFVRSCVRACVHGSASDSNASSVSASFHNNYYYTRLIFFQNLFTKWDLRITNACTVHPVFCHVPGDAEDALCC